MNTGIPALKSFVSDDAVATVGFTNLDYIEASTSVLMAGRYYEDKGRNRIQNDYPATKDCREITIEDTRKISLSLCFRIF